MKITPVISFVILCVIVGVVIFERSKPTAEATTKTIDTPDGQITATTTTVDPVPQEIVLVSKDQCRVFDEQAIKAKNFVQTYLPTVTMPSLKDFDEAFRIWQSTKDKRYSENEVTEMLGAYLGNKLAEDFQMEWVVVKDKYGTDYAVRGKKFEVISFPFSSVLKRIEKNEYDFM